LVEISLAVLKKMGVGFDVREGDEGFFHVLSDGKCSLRGLRVDRCVMLAEWEQNVPAV
jgi:hypothetical protein